jgi:hypothetical protein
VSRVDLEARRIEFRLLRPNEHRPGAPAPRPPRPPRKGETVEQRRARHAARRLREMEKRDKGRGKVGVGGLRRGPSRRRGG